MDLPDQTFRSVTKYVTRIKTLFQILYVAIAAYLVFATFEYLGQHNSIHITIARLMGKTGIILYILTLLPGIARRLKFRSNALSLCMIFRRQVGILMFLTVFVHFWILRGIRIFILKTISYPFLLFEIMGLSAILLTFILFITANDISVRRLRSGWHTIHTLTYIIVWLIFFHVALIDLSVWTILIGITAVLEIYSLLKSSRSRTSQQS